MNLEEAVKLADKSEPETMKKVATVMAILDKMAPDFTQDVINDFKNISEVADSKLASINLAAIGTGVGISLLAGLGTALSSDLYDAAKRGLTKGRNYQRIMEANPQLKEVKDKSHLRKVYDSLHRYAPEFTADPLMGGALLFQIAQGSEFTPNSIFTAIKSRKELIDARNNQFKLPNIGDKFLPRGGKKPDSTGPSKMETNEP